MNSNLPPGVTESMLPGNSSEELAFEKLIDYICDTFSTLGWTVDECETAFNMGIESFKIAKYHFDDEMALRLNNYNNTAMNKIHYNYANSHNDNFSPRTKSCSCESCISGFQDDNADYLIENIDENMNEQFVVFNNRFQMELELINNLEYFMCE